MVGVVARQRARHGTGAERRGLDAAGVLPSHATMDPSDLKNLDPNNLPEGVELFEVNKDAALASLFAAFAAAISEAEKVKESGDTLDAVALAQAFEAARIAAEGAGATFKRLAEEQRAKGDEKGAELMLKAGELLKTRLAEAVATVRLHSGQPDDGSA